MIVGPNSTKYNLGYQKRTSGVDSEPERRVVEVLSLAPNHRICFFVDVGGTCLRLYVISWKPFLLSGAILFLGLVAFSGALNNQEMAVTRLPAIRFGLNRYGFEYFFKPDRSSMVSGSIY